MRGLSLTQPWATLVAIGAKKIETRGWGHSYRGPVAIHAALKVPEGARDFCDTDECQEALAAVGAPRLVGELPAGALIAVADIETMFRFTDTTREKIIERSREGGLPLYEAFFGDYTAGRWGIVFRNVRQLQTPIRCRGALSLWEVPGDVERAILDQLTQETATR